MTRASHSSVSRPIVWTSEGLRVVNRSGGLVAKVERPVEIKDYKEQRAAGESITRLVAAAPELLEALEFVQQLIKVRSPGELAGCAWGTAEAMVRDAISKATGHG